VCPGKSCSLAAHPAVVQHSTPYNLYTHNHHGGSQSSQLPAKLWYRFARTALPLVRPLALAPWLSRSVPWLPTRRSEGDEGVCTHVPPTSSSPHTTTHGSLWTEHVSLPCMLARTNFARPCALREPVPAAVRAMVTSLQECGASTAL